MTSPRAPTRSAASTTREYSSSGRTICRSKIFGRSWYAISSASANPAVMTSTVGSPVRSSSAFVATVLPSRTSAIRSAGIAAPGGTPSRWRIPATAGSAYRAGFSDSSLCTASVPSGRRATTSVNVPPLSTQNSQRPAAMFLRPPPGPAHVTSHAVSKHLKVLAGAGLVSQTKDAQRRPVHLEAEVLDLLTAWIERYRREAEERYRRLDRVLAAMPDDVEPVPPTEGMS